jgi:hypothetical protein
MNIALKNLEVKNCEFERVSIVESKRGPRRNPLLNDPLKEGRYVTDKPTYIRR